MRLAPKAAFLLAGLAASGMAFAQSNSLPENQPMDINGVQAVCTGTTTDVRMDPQWQSYSLRLEFAGKAGQYLGKRQICFRALRWSMGADEITRRNLPCIDRCG